MGLRNNYRKSMPFFEAIAKDISCLVREGIFFIQNGGKLPVWVAAPTYPSKKTTLSKIMRTICLKLLSPKVLCTARSHLKNFNPGQTQTIIWSGDNRL